MVRIVYEVETYFVFIIAAILLKIMGIYICFLIINDTG